MRYLPYGLQSIEIHLERKNCWPGPWVNAMLFVPAPDACPLCMAMAKEYPIAKCPIPVLDTHLGCRCSYTPAHSETYGVSAQPRKRRTVLDIIKGFFKK
jgi:hypothetical protein